MTSKDVKPSLQDFSLIKTRVDNVTQELELSTPSLGFYFFALDLILNLQNDEIEDTITDTKYLSETSDAKGHDRGIDAVFIDESEALAVVNLFSFKYTDKFNKTENNYPSGEIDKICGFLSAIMQRDENIINTVNPILYSKVEEIWDLYVRQNPKFVIHICSNYYHSFEKEEKNRFEKEISKYSDIGICYHLMPNFVGLLTKKGKQVVNARIQVIDKNIFEKSDGDIRAIIIDVDTRDLLRIVIDDESIRDTVDLDDYSILTENVILEDAFEDNVRVYLKQRSKINRNIKETALSDDSHRFFYFNNGITITCSRFSYPKKLRAPIIDLSNLQIVNGSQTIHALFEAFVENQDNFEEMDILCRIYETRNEELSTNIAEYTNSQNPVKSRDIRSNDFVQKKLESELQALGYYYERKKGQYARQPKSKRIDAEKAGQALMAFYNKMPAEAKDKKRLIFAEMYDEVFADEISADSIILGVELFWEIERRKLIRKKEILNDSSLYDDESFILHATYYLMYVISELADKRSVEKSNSKFSEIIFLYDVAVDLIRKSITTERKRLAGYKDNYSHRMFFKGNQLKTHIGNLIKKY